MELKQAICPSCGAPLQVGVEDGSVGICKYCHNEYIVDNAVKLSTVDIDKTKDIRNLRKLLDEAVDGNNITAIAQYSGKIREIISEDFSARYYHAYADFNKNKPTELNTFLEADVTSATPSELRKVINHLIQTSDLRYRSQVESFLRSIDGVDNAQLVSELSSETVKKKRREENYDIVPRDCFICHRSKDIDVTKAVVQGLEQDGNKCWVSERNLRPNDSDNYWENIEAAIKSCNVFVMICSEDAMMSRDVKNEIKIAKDLGKPRVEYKIDDSVHTEMVKDFFDGAKWVDAIDNPMAHIHDLVVRIFDTIQGLNGVKKPNEIDELKEFIKNNALNNVKSIGNENDQNVSVLSANGDKFLSLGEHDRAEECYNQIIKKYPDKYQGWFGMVKLLTSNFTDITDTEHAKYMKNAIAVATEQEQRLMQDKYKVFCAKRDKRDKQLELYRNNIKEWKKHNRKQEYASELIEAFETKNNELRKIREDTRGHISENIKIQGSSHTRELVVGSIFGLLGNINSMGFVGVIIALSVMGMAILKAITIFGVIFILVLPLVADIFFNWMTLDNYFDCSHGKKGIFLNIISFIPIVSIILYIILLCTRILSFSNEKKQSYEENDKLEAKVDQLNKDILAQETQIEILNKQMDEEAVEKDKLIAENTSIMQEIKGLESYYFDKITYDEIAKSKDNDNISNEEREKEKKNFLKNM